MDKTVQLKQWIEKNPMRYAPLLDFYKNGASISYIDNSSCYLYNSDINILYAEGDFIMHDVFIDTYLVCTSSDAIKDELCKRHITNDPFAVATAIYKDTNFNFITRDEYDIHRLTNDHLDFVVQHYDNVGNSIENIKACIQRGMYGLFHNNKQIGFIGVHEEGTMGYLYILEDYRKRGLAYYLEGYLIKTLLDEGKLPYCHVLVENTPSLALQKKLGLSLIKEPFYWLGKDEL